MVGVARCRRLRYVLAAAAVHFEKAQGGSDGIGWSDLSLELLRRAPDRLAVLRRFVERFYPTSWSGSRAAIVATRAKLLELFEGGDDEQVAVYARETRARMLRDADRMRREEAERDKVRNEAFE